MSFSFDIKDVTIKGSIDRIDEDRNGVKIIDYKTSKIASSAKSSLQLAVYCLYLLQSSNDKIKGLPNKAVLHFFKR